MLNRKLEAWIDESNRRCKRAGYNPGRFIAMRAASKGDSRPVIERWVCTTDDTSGWKRMIKLNLIEWSIEACVLLFPEEFSEKARIYARFRYETAKLKKSVA